MIKELKAAINKHGGLAHANRFEVFITHPAGISDDGGRDLNLFCESAMLPGKQITTMEWALFGHPIKVPISLIQEDVTLLFNLSNDYYAKRIFDKWQGLVIDKKTALLAYDAVFKGAVEIRQLNEQDIVTYTTKLNGAYPISVQSINLDNTADNTLSKVSVTFCYDDFDQV